MMHGKAICKTWVDEIAKAFRDIACGLQKGTYCTTYKYAAARVSMLTQVKLWPMAIKLNPS